MTRLITSKQPYASVWLAVYEPLIMKWVSGLALVDLHTRMYQRAAAPRPAGDVAIAGGALAGTLARYRWGQPAARPVAAAPAAPSGTLARIAHAVGRDGESRSLPMPVLAGGVRAVAVDDGELATRRAALDALFADADLTVEALADGLKQVGPGLVGQGLDLVLSPIGIAHLFRQLYFDAGAGLGPLEQAFTIAPGEELEIVQEQELRTSIERIETFGSETTQENSSEETTLEEISDHVQSSISRDMNVGISATASGSVEVFSASATGSFELALSTERATEQTITRSLSQTKKSSEVMRKSYSLTVRTATELTQRSAMRRVLRNPASEPVSYGLRRVTRTVRVKLQAVGVHLVWQLYVSRPGAGLARSRMVMFREADAVAPPDLPPNAPPRPQSGSLAGTQTVDIETVSLSKGRITLAVALEQSKILTAMIVDSIADPQPEGKSPTPPGLVVEEYSMELAEDGKRALFSFGVVPGSAKRATVTYTVHFEPSPSALTEWEDKVKAARAQFDAAQMEEHFERSRRVIAARSRVRSRPAADLRGEERYEILNRMISEAFVGASTQNLPAPAEVELFHRYFDVRALFYYVHPSWWRPRYQLGREDYEITDDSEPAPFGKSLGWLIQLDGDRRRNEFLNSPWVRVCMPIRPGMEEAACDWLAEHIEGQRGFDRTAGSRLGKLLEDVRARREKETLALPGPEYVTLDGEVAPGREAAAEAFPVVDEFDVVVPTEGFVYVPLEVEE